MHARHALHHRHLPPLRPHRRRPPTSATVPARAVGPHPRAIASARAHPPVCAPRLPTPHHTVQPNPSCARARATRRSRAPEAHGHAPPPSPLAPRVPPHARAATTAPARALAPLFRPRLATPRAQTLGWRHGARTDAQEAPPVRRHRLRGPRVRLTACPWSWASRRRAFSPSLRLHALAHAPPRAHAPCVRLASLRASNTLPRVRGCVAASIAREYEYRTRVTKAQNSYSDSYRKLVLVRVCPR